MNSNILCADIGTTSLKAGIINSNGEVVSFSVKQFSATQTDFIANNWFQEFIQCAVQMTQNTEIHAICISGNGPTVISDNGRTLLWNCENTINQNEFSETKSLFIPKFCEFKKKFSDDFEKTQFLFGSPEYLIYKLTNNAVSILPEERFVPAYWTDEELEKYNIPCNKIPHFVSTGYNAGNTTKEITESLNLSKPIPVFCGGPDFIVALIGTNTLSKGKVCDRAGSSEGINLCSKNPVFVPGFRTLPSVIPGLWNISVINNKSGILFAEYKKQLETEFNKQINYEDLFSDSIEDKNSQGFFILSEILNNFSNSLDKLKKLAKENDIPFSEPISITGGQAKNSKWVQLKAENSKTDISICNAADSELIGNAVIALYGLGKFNSLQDAANNIVKQTKTFSCKNNSNKMKIYKLQKNCDTIIFDIDSTLYTNQAYAIEQVDTQIRFFAKKQNISESKARTLISNFRKEWSKQHDGKKISLGNTLTHFGVTIQDSIKMRETLLEPSLFLKKDEKLIQTICKLKEKFKIICVTNNPVLPARKTLEAIGIAELIPEIIGLDTCLKSKPAKEPFELAVKKMNTTPEKCISIGDRYDMDISLPLELGMSGILVYSVNDVYELPELLMQNNS